MNTDGSRALLQRWDLALSVVVMLTVVATGCDFSELPRLEGRDAGVDGPPVDGPLLLPNCLGLATTCGPGMNESCCSAEIVPGGQFYRGYDGTVSYPDMGSPATVSPYVLDVYEVTVGRFRAFVNAGYGTQEHPPAAGSGAHPRLPGSGWDPGWNTNLAATTSDLVSAVKLTVGAGTNDIKPMIFVGWYDAMAFCIWDGGYLPTEAEWNYAASGGEEQRAYPWSTDPASSKIIDCTYANYYDLHTGNTGTFCAGTTPHAVAVGSKSPKGDGRWGQADLAGNVWEWMLDLYADPYPAPCSDCANLTAGSDRVIRGGSSDADAGNLRTGFRIPRDPTDRASNHGFRCARSAP